MRLASPMRDSPSLKKYQNRNIHLQRLTRRQKSRKAMVCLPRRPSIHNLKPVITSPQDP
ncbi:hypothetical protein Ac2012v2_002468 [Leucoagaricus gongylophorus]